MAKNFLPINPFHASKSIKITQFLVTVGNKPTTTLTTLTTTDQSTYNKTIFINIDPRGNQGAREVNIISFSKLVEEKK